MSASQLSPQDSPELKRKGAGHQAIIVNIAVWLLLLVSAIAWARAEWPGSPISQMSTEEMYASSTAIKILLFIGVDPNNRSAFGTTPLHMAADYGTPDTIRALIRSGAYVNARDYINYGATPLHWAADGNLDNIHALLDAGANPNARTDSGITPLHFAARHGSAANISALINAGADLNAQDKRGMTPLDLARGYSATNALRGAGAKRGGDL